MEQKEPDSAIHIEKLSVNYRHTPALSDVCLDVPRGEFLGIIGPNGGGKTTLLKAILGLVPISGGTISVFGQNKIASRKPIGYVPQFSAVDRSFPISVKEVVMTAFMKGALHPFFRYSAENRDRALEQLERVSIGELAERQISELSGGEFQRLLIARALAVDPEILLLDEPTASVDPASRDKIYDLLAELNDDVTVILVTHDLMAIASEVTSLACINRSLVYYGKPELNDTIAHEMYGCHADKIARGVPHGLHIGSHHEEEGQQC
ncbi:MAG: ABC transporter ATP-binding protein [Oscillospiraceae bacterium]